MVRVTTQVLEAHVLGESGAALAVELLEAQRELERRLRHLERLVTDY